MCQDCVVGGAAVEENFGIGAREACGCVFGAIVAEAEGDGFRAVVFCFENGGPVAVDLLESQKERLALTQ